MNFCKRLVESKDPSKDMLVITVDNGIACADEVKYLKDNGIEVIVTDHHVAKDLVPDCIIVDPHNNNEPDTYKHLAGCGVAFKVAQMVHWILDSPEALKMFKYLVPVAIGTISDMMPMSLENIALIKYGLGIINSDNCPNGIKAMKDYMGKEVLTSEDISWEIGPKINACSRMGDVYLAAKIFFEDLKFGETMDDVVNQIEKLNTERKDFTKKAKTFVDKVDCSNDVICMIDASDYPAGIIGIIANKFIEKYNKLTIVLADEGDKMVGSARSIDGINLQQILKAEFEKGNIVEYGGHESAAGLTIKKEKFEELKFGITKTVEEIMKSLPKTEAEEPELIIDELIQLKHINQATYDLINSVPYDNKTFVAPVFALIDVAVEKFSISKNNPDNICFTIDDESGKKDIWGWGFAPIYKKLGKPKKLHIAGTVERDFMKPKTFTFKIIDILGAE
jgi:single-stranded-DNA-specific exonuclease